MAGREITFYMEQAPEGGYMARAFGRFIFTQAETMDQLRKKVRATVCRCFDSEKGYSFVTQDDPSE